MNFVRLSLVLLLILSITIFSSCGKDSNEKSSNQKVQESSVSTPDKSNNSDVKKEDKNIHDTKEIIADKKAIEQVFTDIEKISVQLTTAKINPATWNDQEINTACNLIFWHPNKDAMSSRRELLYESKSGRSNAGQMWIADVERFAIAYKINNIILHSADDKYNMPWAELEFTEKETHGKERYPHIKSIALYYDNNWHIYEMGSLIEISKDSKYDGKIDENEYMKLLSAK